MMATRGLRRRARRKSSRGKSISRVYRSAVIRGVEILGVEAIHGKRRLAEEHFGSRVDACVEEYAERIVGAVRQEQLLPGERRNSGRFSRKSGDTRGTLRCVLSRGARELFGTLGEQPAVFSFRSSRSMLFAAVTGEIVSSFVQTQHDGSEGCRFHWRTVIAASCARRPSARASAVATGPTRVNPFRSMVWTLMHFTKSSRTEATATARPSACGQNVIAAAGVIADGLRAPFAQENCSGCGNVIELLAVRRPSNVRCSGAKPIHKINGGVD
jgi:hypothetical protein